MKPPRSILPGIVVAVALVALREASTAQEKAGVVTTLHGTATVARVTLPQPAPLKFRDDVYVADRIATGEQSVVRILLGGKAVVTVRERSILSISETPTTSTVDLATGKIALSVAKDRMKPGDAVEIRTPNAVAGIRGTVVLADVSAAAAAVTTTFTALTGVVDVLAFDNTGTPIGPRIVLNPLQSVSVTGRGGAGAVQTLTSADRRRLGGEYRSSVTPAPMASSAGLPEQQFKAALGSLRQGADHLRSITRGPLGSITRGPFDRPDLGVRRDGPTPITTKVPAERLTKDADAPARGRGRGRGRGAR